MSETHYLLLRLYLASKAYLAKQGDPGCQDEWHQLNMACEAVENRFGRSIKAAGPVAADPAIAKGPSLLMEGKRACDE